MFHGISTSEQILILLEAGFRDLNGKVGVSLPKLLVGFNGGLYCFLDAFSERISVILNKSGTSCAHYCYIKPHSLGDTSHHSLYTHSKYLQLTITVWKQTPQLPPPLATHIPTKELLIILIFQSGSQSTHKSLHPPTN